MERLQDNWQAERFAQLLMEADRQKEADESRHLLEQIDNLEMQLEAVPEELEPGLLVKGIISPFETVQELCGGIRKQVDALEERMARLPGRSEKAKIRKMGRERRYGKGRKFKAPRYGSGGDSRSRRRNGRRRSMSRKWKEERTGAQSVLQKPQSARTKQVGTKNGNHPKPTGI